MESILRPCAAGPTTGRLARRDLYLLALLVALNLLWRLLRYALDFPLWGDEAMLAVNFIDRDWLQLLQPLDYVQVAPVGFLWAEWLIGRLVGVCAFSLRLLPLLTGMASVLLFVRLAGRWLPRREALLAAAVFCASYYPVRHGVEVKPYASDLFFALVLLTCAARLRERLDSLREWIVFGGLGCVAIWSSYPAAFVAGGIELFLLPAVLRGRDGRRIAVWVVTGLLLALSLGASVVLFAEGQAESAADFRDSTMWRIAFPPVDRPWEIPWWLLKTHAGRMMAYPAGGKNFASIATLLLVVTGATVLWRRCARDRQTLWLLLSAPLLALIAAALKKYPYGGSIRTSLYLAPAICMLAGIGLLQLVRSWNRPSKVRRGFITTVALLGCVQVGGMIRDVVRPYKTPADLENRRLVERLIDETDADQDSWVIANAILADPGSLGTLPGPGLTVAPFGFYARTMAPVPVYRGNPVNEVHSNGRQGRVFLLIHDTISAPLPAAAIQTCIDSLRDLYGSPEEQTWPIDENEFLRVLIFPSSRKSE